MTTTALGGAELGAQHPWRRRIARNWERLHGPSRVAGIDLARGLAVLGMLAAHLLWTGELRWDDPSTWDAIVNGRSSILFATLAGVSLGLASGGAAPPPSSELGAVRGRLAVRAILIWMCGIMLIGLDVPAAIILPAYAVIFLLALPLLALSASRLFVVAAAVAVVAPPLVVWVNSFPWWWSTVEGWSFSIFTGWNYPFPLWIAFTLAGLGLARAGLHRPLVQWVALGAGALLAVAAYALAAPESSDRSTATPFLEGWWTADPHSSGALEAIGSGGFAIAVIGFCLLISSRVSWTWATFPIRAVGSMPLSAYIVQIVAWAIISKVVLGSTHEHSFRDIDPFLPMTVPLILGATAWSLLVGQGPIETVMSSLTAQRKRRPAA